VRLGSALTRIVLKSSFFHSHALYADRANRMQFYSHWIKRGAGERAQADNQGGIALKTYKSVIAILLISSASASPAFANYFRNPTLNIGFNVGSAPSPTVWDIQHNSLPQMTHNGRPKFDVAKSAPSGRSAAIGQSDASKATTIDTASTLRLSQR
jgi:hypothetical protein